MLMPRDRVGVMSDSLTAMERRYIIFIIPICMDMRSSTKSAKVNITGIPALPRNPIEKPDARKP
jgi:hypothetical protein